MKSLWNDKAVKPFLKDPLQLRVYTSRLLGQDSNLVLHGGGNTSVKATVKNAFGEKEDILYVKGSGWDLATIEAEGFAPVKMDALLKMAKLKTLSDSKMVSLQRAAMIDPYAPNPSVEAILHAIIPYKFVDHTHADSVVTVTNTPGGEKRIREIYGNNILVVPYVMPGFILAKTIYEMTKNIDWDKCKGMILLNHGVFSFDNDAKKSYEKMIKLVSKAESYLKRKKAIVSWGQTSNKSVDLLGLAQIRKEVSVLRKAPVIVKLNTSKQALRYSKLRNLKIVASQGPLTPDHVIRTKRIPVIFDKDVSRDLQRYTVKYKQYFKKYKKGSLKILDQAPRWGILPNVGSLSFGTTVKEVGVIHDITAHTIEAIQTAQKLKEWKALSQKHIFDVEYWELEQAKLKKSGSSPEFQGKIAIVTGAASGIGRAALEELHQQGAVVVGVDIDKAIEELNQTSGMRGIICDLTKENQIQQVVNGIVKEFGGIDIVVSNAGIFPLSEKIENLKISTWQKSMDINLTSHQLLMKHCIPFLKYGIDPAIVIIASKNVPAPGPGASAYSVAKAGLTQLARVAALELAQFGIRVNTIHPNAVFDTAIWTNEVVSKRAKSYRMSVEEYKKNNLLKTEIFSNDVAKLVCAMAGAIFSKTTGAQVPLDGGNERVI